MLVTSALIILGVVARIPELLGLAAAALTVLVAGAVMTMRGRPVQVLAHVPSRVERGSDAYARLIWADGQPLQSGVRVVDRRGRSSGPVRWEAAPGEAWVGIPTQRRGERVIGPWRIERSDPWGVFTRRLADVEGSVVLVTPRIHHVALANLPMAFTDHAGAGDAGSTTFASLREYVVGDEPRHIHWRSSAKTGSLMTRQYIDVTRPRIHLVLATDRRAFVDDSDFELTVDLVASIATVVHAAGFDVDVRLTTGEALRARAIVEALSFVQVLHVTSSADRRLLRLPAATTMVITGHGQRGWWERIPSTGVVRP